MQHVVGQQYGQGTANSHQTSPQFAHIDFTQQNGGNTISSLRQFRKKDGTIDKQLSHDLNLVTTTNPTTTTTRTTENIARVPPHNYYPTRTNEFYRYQRQYNNFNSRCYKDILPQVRYSEIAETPQFFDVPPALSPPIIQKYRNSEIMEGYKSYNNSNNNNNTQQQQQQQQNYSIDSSSSSSLSNCHIKEAQIHHQYKPESQYQYSSSSTTRYNMQLPQCRKYQTTSSSSPSTTTISSSSSSMVPSDNDFLTKLQQINPTMARSIINEHHLLRDAYYNPPPPQPPPTQPPPPPPPPPPSMEQNRIFAQNQRFYPSAPPSTSTIQNNYNPYNLPPPPPPPQYNNYPNYFNYNRNSCNNGRYSPPVMARNPRLLNYEMNYGGNMGIPPKLPQFNPPPPEYSQHYQRCAYAPPDYYYHPSHYQQQQQQQRQQLSTTKLPPPPPNVPRPVQYQQQISETTNQTTSGLRHYLENWAEEDLNIDNNGNNNNNDNDNRKEVTTTTTTTAAAAPEQQEVFVLNTNEECLETTLPVITNENAQILLKNNTIDSSLIRLINKEPENLHIIDNNNDNNNSNNDDNKDETPPQESQQPEQQPQQQPQQQQQQQQQSTNTNSTNSEDNNSNNNNNNNNTDNNHNDNSETQSNMGCSINNRYITMICTEDNHATECDMSAYGPNHCNFNNIVERTFEITTKHDHTGLESSFKEIIETPVNIHE